MKPTVITATIRPNDAEMVQVCVEFGGMAYPQVLAEACAKVRGLVHDLTADQLKLYAERDQASQGGAAAVDPGPDAR